jgi:hypothetical protein
LRLNIGRKKTELNNKDKNGKDKNKMDNKNKIT